MYKLLLYSLVVVLFLGCEKPKSIKSSLATKVKKNKVKQITKTETIDLFLSSAKIKKIKIAQVSEIETICTYGLDQEDLIDYSPLKKDIVNFENLVTRSCSTVLEGPNCGQVFYRPGFNSQDIIKCRSRDKLELILGNHYSRYWSATYNQFWLFKNVTGNTFDIYYIYTTFTEDRINKMAIYKVTCKNISQ